VTYSPTSLDGLVFFSEEYSYVVRFPHNVTLVVTAHIGCCKVSKILVNGGSSVNILYGHTLDRMDDTPRAGPKIISQTYSLLYEFYGNEARPLGMVEFPVRADSLNVIMEFNILDVPSPYNASLGRPWIHMMRAVSFTYHQLLKYPTPFGTANIKGDQAMARTVVAVVQKRSGWMKKATGVDPNELPCG